MKIDIRDIETVCTTKEDDNISAFFESLLTDPYVNKFDIEELQSLHNRLKEGTNCSDLAIGALGFLLFSEAAEQSNKTVADSALGEDRTFHFICSKYDLSGIRQNFETIEFYMKGTTSFILKTRHSNQTEFYVLKLLKYRFKNNATIKKSTSAYNPTYGSVGKYVPRIIKSDNNFILMEFIEGKTLSDYLATQFSDVINKDVVVKNIFMKLCIILKYLAEEGFIHGDLNPTNIILRNSDQIDRIDVTPETIDLILIDFGINYLLTEPVGAGGSLAMARTYIADEVLDNKATMMSDIYSLGVLLLRLYLWDTEDRFDYMHFDSYLDYVRTDTPILASILDDILNKNPLFRLFDIRDKYGINTLDDISNDIKRAAPIYSDLMKDLYYEFQIKELQTSGKKDKSDIATYLQYFSMAINFATGNIKAVKDLIREKEFMGKHMDKFRLKKGDYNFRELREHLSAYASLASFSHIVILILFSYLAKKTIEMHDWGMIRARVPGLLICFTFSVIASQYYLNIFRDVYTANLGELGIRVNRGIRFCSWQWPIPIIVAYFTDVEFLWPLISAYGTWAVASNNRGNNQLVKKAQKKIKEVFHEDLSATTQAGLRIFDDWGPMNYLYSIALLVIFILLPVLNKLNDDLAYFAIALVLNFKIWKYPCNKNSQRVRNSLHFIYSRYERALKYERQQIDSTYASSCDKVLSLSKSLGNELHDEGRQLDCQMKFIDTAHAIVKTFSTVSSKAFSTNSVQRIENELTLIKDELVKESAKKGAEERAAEVKNSRKE
jgi:serine/threonine protein kinase